MDGLPESLFFSRTFRSSFSHSIIVTREAGNDPTSSHSAPLMTELFEPDVHDGRRGAEGVGSRFRASINHMASDAPENDYPFRVAYEQTNTTLIASIVLIL
jgi:hypothetical protein